MPNQENTLKKFYYKTYTECEKLQNKYLPRNKKAVKTSKRLSVRCTDEEYKIIELKSKEARMSKAEFLKQSALGKEIKRTDPLIVTKIVEMEEKIVRLSFYDESEAKLLKNELNTLKDEFFADYGGF